MTKDFFSIIGLRHTRSRVQQLRTPNGSLASTFKDMRELATRFYGQLLLEEPPTVSMAENRCKILSHVRRTTTHAMRVQLLAPFFKDELLDAVRTLARDSCLGVDGLSTAFFLRHWEMLSASLCMAFQKIMTSRTLPKSFKGLIFLIPKEGGNVEEIQHWQPITILKSAYKILGKALSLRLQHVLDTLIHPRNRFCQGA